MRAQAGGYTNNVVTRRVGRLKHWILLGLMLPVLGCGGGGATSVPQSGNVDVNYTAAAAAMDRFNLYRSLAAVQPVELDSYLSLGCQYHAIYLTVNNVSLRDVQLAAHSEDPSLPGYSSRGDQAGRSSIIYQGVTPVEAIDNWMRTFYHRLGMLDPNLHYVGFGSQADYQVMDVLSGRVGGLVAAPGAVIYPAPGMTNVPRDYKREIPHPIPGDDKLGIPITIEFFGTWGRYIAQVDSKVVDVTAGGTAIPCYVQTPNKPFLADWAENQVIALIPMDPLPAVHTIRVEVNAMIDGERWSAEWEFSTQ
jgi:hypothetical protein